MNFGKGFLGAGILILAGIILVAISNVDDTTSCSKGWETFENDKATLIINECGDYHRYPRTSKIYTEPHTVKALTLDAREVIVEYDALAVGNHRMCQVIIRNHIRSEIAKRMYTEVRNLDDLAVIAVDVVRGSKPEVGCDVTSISLGIK